MALYRVTVIGSGKWGSVIAKLVASNAAKYQNLFDYKVYMYVYEEMVDGQKLSEIINNTHHNVKYLPGYQLPDNVVAIPDLFKACVGCDILLFVLPPEFVSNICKQLRYRIKKTAFAVTMIKGLNMEEGRLSLISNIIRRELNIPCASLMGANTASAVADNEFCEATIGCSDVQQAELLKKLFEEKNFRIRCVPDEETVELCGALKSIISLAAGMADGLKIGGRNTRAAIVRLGFMEMIEFCRRYFPNTRLETFFESCAIADLISSSYDGRNKIVAERFVTETDMTIEELEAEMLGGQRLQGPQVCSHINSILEKEIEMEKNVMQKFPIFRMVHLILTKKIAPSEFSQCVENHPQHGSI